MRKIFLALGILALVSCGSMEKKTDYIEREPQQVIVDAGLANKFKVSCRASIRGSNGKKSQLVGSPVDDATNTTTEPAPSGIIGAKGYRTFFIPVADLFQEKDMTKRFKVTEFPGVEVSFYVGAGHIYDGDNGGRDTGDIDVNAQAQVYRNGKEILTVLSTGLSSTNGVFRKYQNASANVSSQDAVIKGLSLHCTVTNK